MKIKKWFQMSKFKQKRASIVFGLGSPPWFRNAEPHSGLKPKQTNKHFISRSSRTSQVRQTKQTRRQGGQGREEIKRILQERHLQTNHSRSIRPARKEGSGNLQEAKHRNARPTRSRNDQESTDSQLSIGKKTSRRTVGPPRKATRGQQDPPNIQG